MSPTSHLLQVTRLLDSVDGAVDGRLIEVLADELQPLDSPSTMPQGRDMAGWCETSKGAVLVIISTARITYSSRLACGPGSGVAFSGMVGISTRSYC
jgi:hypothetical protein